MLNFHTSLFPMVQLVIGQYWIQWWLSAKQATSHYLDLRLLVPGLLCIIHASQALPYVNTLRLRQNGRHFPDDIFKWIFWNENVWILIKISLKFVPQGPINNIPGLVQIMAWRRPGDKPLSGPMMVRLPTHISCVTRPQWVNDQKVSVLKGLICLRWRLYQWGLVMDE